MMIAVAESIDEAGTFRRCVGRWRWRRVLCHLFHLLAQAEWPHVGPHFLDVSETFGFGSDFPRIVPTGRVLSILWPDRILLLVIDHDFVDSFVFVFVIERHLSSSSGECNFIYAACGRKNAARAQEEQG